METTTIEQATKPVIKDRPITLRESVLAALACERKQNRLLKDMEEAEGDLKLHNAAIAEFLSTSSAPVCIKVSGPKGGLFTVSKLASSQNPGYRIDIQRIEVVR